MMVAADTGPAIWAPPTVNGNAMSVLAFLSDWSRRLPVCLAVICLASLPLAARERVTPPSQAVVQYSFAPIVRRAAPAVVNVYVRSRVQTFRSPFADDPIFGRLFGERLGQPTERVQNSLGSGVLVSPEGVIVTNTHVVKGSGATEIRVALQDKREFDAKVISQDEKTDIAVLKLESNGERFPFIEFEDSDTLEVGDMVLAIGNPFGVGQTVTSGIVSALARSEIGLSDAQVFIQTDAAINPGNSGGALVDMDGKLVGINTMIFSRSGGSHGIGFAIPSNLVRLYADSALKGQKVERPWLGARLESVTREFAEALGLDRVTGAAVVKVYDRGPAADAGLKPGDVIVRVEGFEVTDARSALYRLTTRGIGNTAKLDVLRQGRPESITVALAAAPKPGRDDVRNLSGSHPFDGTRVSNVRPSIADEMGIDDTEGVVIMSVRPGSIAANIGFQPGDIILQVGRRKISTVAELESEVRDRQRIWQLAIKRGERVIQLQVQG